MSTSPMHLDDQGQVAEPIPDRRPDAMIAIMGSTGTGKSSLVRLITGDQNIKIGHSVESETSEIKTANHFEPDGRCITIVDTPGFDDSREGVTDTMILKKIASFLEARYKDGKKTLNGIIYLHRITDPRMGGISTRNLRMFRQLCGSDSLKNVVIVTTRWDTADADEAITRENELMTNQNFFQPLVSKGARFLRHNASKESAYQIMKQLLDKDPIPLQIQVELANGKALNETAAGSELNAQMNALIEKHKAEIQEMRKEMRKAIAEKDESWKQELEQEREKRQELLAKWNSEKQRLEEGLDSVRKHAEVEKVAMDERVEEQRKIFLDEIAKQKTKIAGMEKSLEAARQRKEIELARQSSRRNLHQREQTVIDRAHPDRKLEELLTKGISGLRAELLEESRRRQESESKAALERKELQEAIEKQRELLVHIQELNAVPEEGLLRRRMEIEDSFEKQYRPQLISTEEQKLNYEKDIDALKIEISTLRLRLSDERRSQEEFQETAQREREELEAELEKQRQGFLDKVGFLDKMEEQKVGLRSKLAEERRRRKEYEMKGEQERKKLEAAVENERRAILAGVEKQKLGFQDKIKKQEKEILLLHSMLQEARGNSGSRGNERFGTTEVEEEDDGEEEEDDGEGEGEEDEDYEEDETDEHDDD